jgi:hypothetical protein
MTKYIVSLLTAVLFFSITPTAHAAISPVSVSIVPPAQFPPNDFAITGARVSALWGKHRNVYGIDVGLLGNITEQTFTGLAVSGIFNKTMGTTTITGLQFAGITNINTSKTRIFGLQAALGANINSAESSVTGLQFALANISGFTTIYGVQAGVYNKAKEVYGFQIGLVNVTDNLHGIQIGLVNFNKSGPFAISPILNVGF